MRKIMLGMMLVAGSLAAPAASAADNDEFGWYVGFSGGRSRISSGGNRLAFQMRQDGHRVADSDITFDTNDRSGKLFAGAEFNRYFGVELGYAELGDIDLQVTSTSTNPSAFFASLAENQPVGAEGVYADLMGRYPILDNLQVYARLGAINWQSDVSYQLPNTLINNQRGGVDAHWGLGLRYDLSSQFSASLEWERFDTDTKVEILGLALRFHFH